MAFYKVFCTKADIDIKLYDKSLIIMGRRFVNGAPFTEAHAQLLHEAINQAYAAGRSAQVQLLKNVLEIK